MTTQVELDGVTLISAREAAKRVSYSRDYLAKLAREKKIVAAQVGRQWFVDMNSLNSFIEGVTFEREIRKKQLSEERKRERLVKQKLDHLVEKFDSRSLSLPLRSFAAAFTVLVIGVFVGSSIYSSGMLSDVLIINTTASSFSSNDSSDSNTKIVNIGDKDFEIAAATTVVEEPLFVDQAEVKEVDGFKDGILLFSQDSKLDMNEDVANLFSDPVNINFEDDNHGVVEFVKDNGDVTVFPFVSIPDNAVKEEVNNSGP